MEEPISLYLELEAGHVADLEMVARASLAFSAAVKELAYVLDPSSDISLKLSSGTEGSLSLNTIITSIKDHSTDRKKLVAIAVVVLCWFANDARQYAVQKGLDQVLKDDKKLSKEEIAQIADAVTKALEGKVAKNNVEQVYREIAKDPAVRGVGATPIAGEKPAAIVPRSSFAEHLPAEQEVVTKTRSREKFERVVLISPVLVSGSRRWKFSFHEGEFGAPIKDTAFLDDVLSGKHPITMRAGIELEVLLQTREDFENGVWVVKERTILEVIDTHPGPQQIDLDMPKAAINPKDREE